MVSPLHTRKYRTTEETKTILFVRFPVILRAYFDYDAYNGEMDCSYWFEGVPNLSHLEDLLNVPSEN